MDPTGRATHVARWLAFALAVAGAFYVLMTLSLFVHEVLGHGVAWVLCGGRSLVVSVGPGFAGYVRGDHVPAPLSRVFISWAGIGANALVGLAGYLACRRWPPSLTPRGLALFWLVTTELGQALGYTLMGLIFNQGDAENLPLGPVARVGVSALVFAVFLALAAWSLDAIARFVVEHFQPRDLGELRRTFVLGFALPLGVVVIVAPGLPGRAPWTVAAFDAGVLAVLVVGTLWTVRRLPQPREKPGHPVTWLEVLAWTAAAGATFTVTKFWLDAGVRVDLG